MTNTNNSLSQNTTVNHFDLGQTGDTGGAVNSNDSSGNSVERFADSTKGIEPQIRSMEQKLVEKLKAALAQSNGSAVESKPARVGLTALASGIDGLRARREVATAV